MANETKASEPQIHLRRRGPLGAFRSNFLTGLAVLLPIGLTIWLIWVAVGWIDSWILPFIPHAWQPDTLMERYFGEKPPFSIRGVGVIIFLVFTVLVGWIAKGIIGRSLIAWGEGIVGRMPFVRSIYNALKQFAQSVLTQGDAKFDKACLIEYPRKGVWSVGFVSTPARGELAESIPDDDDILTVFLAMNLLPPSGFLVFVPRRDVIILNRMTVEDTAKLVISAGLVYPEPSGAPSTK
ncbi:MAG: DUF502 domain-containing protein [Proteobacteria bacterium]|nr:DUF502 domain-containing protein [Pseudomonadota bacterium]